jgi:primosomal protein N' (replication factor Y)
MHLDRPFDYAVPENLGPTAVPGARVKVRFAGRRVNGFVLERVEASEHPGKLSSIDSVVSPEPVLAPQIAELARRVADHYVGSVSDVLRLAVPPRHAKVEAEPVNGSAASQAVAKAPSTSPEPTSTQAPWSAFPAGGAFLEQLAAGGAPRAVATAPPGIAWTELVAAATDAASRAGRSVLIVVPDHRDVDDVVTELQKQVPQQMIAALTADLGPAKRYRAWLGIRRGSARVVVGTRAAVFAPVRDAGLLVIWDDGDDLHAEPRAPYPHAREVLAMRSVIEECGYLVIGRTRTAEGERLIRSGWAHALDPDRTWVREHAPVLRTVGDDAELARDAAATSARLPGLALRTARDALAHGPVLVQVPRAGYLPIVACQDCREVAHCDRCHGPLRITAAGQAPVCRWCGSVRHDHTCSSCGSARIRAVRTGSLRTAEELGRAFPGVSVITSGRGDVVARVGDKPALVVATPGAEPAATGGYAAALLLDGDHLLHRADLRADEEALRRWLNAAALVRSTGSVVITAEPGHAAVQALVRWDPQGFAAREFDERAAAHLPPAARVISLDAPAAALEDFMDRLVQPHGTERLGPVAMPGAATDHPQREGDSAEERVRLILRVPLALGAELAAELRRVQAARSAHKAPDHVTVRVDPLELL